MIIVHNEAGLGNQMMDWAEYYLLKKLNPKQDVYVENLLFDVEECKDTVSMWNGYELNRIFDIDSRTDYLQDVIGIHKYRELVEYVKKSEFWDDDWDFPTPITKWLSNNLNICIINCVSGGLGQKISRLKKIRKKINRFMHPLYDIRKAQYILPEGDFYCGHSFPLLQLNGHYDEIIREDMLEIFKFPKILKSDAYNYGIMESVCSNMSIGVHIRRGDLLVYNNEFYENGYFNRAINYIKNHVDNPVWYVFSDEYSREWCIDNYRLLGFSDSDNIIFIKGNSGCDNYKDLHLLSSCKHQVITNSSFGWWGCYLNDFKDKITISPVGTFKTVVGI